VLNSTTVTYNNCSQHFCDL